MRQFEVKGTPYEMKLTQERVKLIERKTGRAILSTLTADDGLLTIDAMEAFFGFAVKEAGADAFLGYTAGRDLLTDALEELGYAGVIRLVNEAAEGDLTFLYRRH